jgi:hypothetical protein
MEVTDIHCKYFIVESENMHFSLSPTAALEWMFTVCWDHIGPLGFKEWDNIFFCNFYPIKYMKNTFPW